MSHKLDWEKLLCEDRERKSNAKSSVHRNGFDMDYDRVISSSSLRRLQDKAQVFPLQENDFTRTRLTHSMEVSALGRSLGQNIAQWLLKQGEFTSEQQARKLPSVLAVACLVHDLGNPPFGHYGEDIIRNWFRKWFDNDKFKKLNDDYLKDYRKPILTEQQKNDFMYFEGNAQGIRILSKLQFLNDQYGINFTYGTLATLIKYPWSSLKAGNRGEKFGYFTSEEDLFNNIQDCTGLDNCKHPVTYLLEAADDIAYLAADIEDGVKKGAVPWEKVYNEAKDKFGIQYKQMFNYLDSLREKAFSNAVPNKDLVDVQNFKVAVQGLMFEAVTATFKSRYKEIMNGAFEGKDLLSISDACEMREFLKSVAIEHCYKYDEVLTLELVGNSVIESLLDLFVEAVVDDNGSYKAKSKNGKIFHLISSNFRHIQKLDSEGNPTRNYSEMSLYNKLMLVTDFVSGMTDSYAVNLHQQLMGVKLP
ncbi:deoxyguanosinetriphosphate triphosphohydrolase [Priestia aryabhattai]|uniref:deoxyguanosinetriphosphate triphosphohydrolase n=1 Tax=Priestia aryabhattai TaxID=412384 RepID=UPI002E23732B|nr:deoxyguanosinetriphosphate triphosphohydrolase [Priestia aryabhattai]MED4012907.1 deoxyguanosinetriphosphate triphosphohydrolase [Priestia aryabhattai]